MNLPIWMFIFVLSNRWRSGLGSTRSWLQSTQYALMCRTWLKGWLWWVLWWILQLSSYLCPRDCEFVWNICFQEVYTSFFCDTTAVSIFTNLLIVDNSYLSSFSPQLCKSFEMLLLIVLSCICVLFELQKVYFVLFYPSVIHPEETDLHFQLSKCVVLATAVNNVTVSFMVCFNTLFIGHFSWICSCDSKIAMFTTRKSACLKMQTLSVT